jgi:hypothetical protein
MEKEATEKSTLRNKSIGTKVSEDEYAALEKLAEARGLTLGEWLRELVLAELIAHPAEQVILAEVLALRMLYLNTVQILGPGRETRDRGPAEADRAGGPGKAGDGAGAAGGAGARREEMSRVGRVKMDTQEVVDLVNSVEGEVNNGGFHQFFYNNAGDNTIETIQALEIIGAKNMADIVRRAAAMFPGGMPPKDRFARQDVLLEKYPRAEAFESLNDEFFAYPDDVARLLAKYKSTHGV